MNKLWSILAPLLLLVSICFGQGKEISRYWINKKIDWKKPATGDSEIDALVEASTVNAMIFHPNGQFRMVSSNGGLANDSINQHADIFRMYKGSWRDLGKGEIELIYFLVDVNGNHENPTKALVFDLKKAELEFEGISYINGSRLSRQTKNRLENLANKSSVKGK
jgi:hypothetical protein